MKEAGRTLHSLLPAMSLYISLSLSLSLFDKNTALLIYSLFHPLSRKRRSLIDIFRVIVLGLVKRFIRFCIQFLYLLYGLVSVIKSNEIKVSEMKNNEKFALSEVFEF